jgi:hypothetical protein
VRHWETLQARESESTWSPQHRLGLELSETRKSRNGYGTGVPRAWRGPPSVAEPRSRNRNRGMSVGQADNRR